MTHRGAASACPSPDEERLARPRTAPEMDGHRDMEPSRGGGSSEEVPCVRLRLSSKLGEEGRLPRLAREDGCRDALTLVCDASREACRE